MGQPSGHPDSLDERSDALQRFVPVLHWKIEFTRKRCERLTPNAMAVQAPAANRGCRESEKLIHTPAEVPRSR